MQTPPPSSSLSPPVSSTKEGEDDTEDVPPSPPPAAPAPKPFDPLKDLLGIEPGARGNHSAAVPQQNKAVQVYTGGGAVPGMYQPATIEHTTADRVANVKGIMAANAEANGYHQQSGFGVAGTNMQVAMYGGLQNPYAHQQAQQQLYNSMASYQAQQQMQQMAAYQTMAYQTMTQTQQVAMYHMQQQQTANGMHNMHMGPMNGMQRPGMMATYTPTPQGNQAVPVMRAEKQTRSSSEYRVQKGTKPARVSASDVAFGPIIDQMKKAHEKN